VENPVDRMRAAVQTVALSLDPSSFALLPTSRNLEAIVDEQFKWQAQNHRWYAALSRGGHIHAVADVDGRRVSLQRYVLTLAEPTLTFDEVKHVSFINKVSMDCRICNLQDRIGRQAVMRNRLPKRNTTSRYKGISKATSSKPQALWKAQIKADADQIFLGYFEDENWAAMIYDAAAYLLFEGSAHYNLPELCPNMDALEIVAAKITRHRSRKVRKIAAKSGEQTVRS
jgi:hypothetical protein